MNNKLSILAPAKLNIFLKVFEKRIDGYHNLRTGVNFINLFDNLEINKSNKFSVTYKGRFKPKDGKYKDCIIYKTLEFLNLNEKIKLDISITKNIPVQGGLGSASTNAAAFIMALEKLNLIKKNNPKKYVALGSDIPCFLFKKNCLVAGRGEKLYHKLFPKYFFLLIKPKFNNSTKEMYLKLGRKDLINDEKNFIDESEINDEDQGNDFEKIIFKENKEFKEIFEFLENLSNSIFSRITGTGSCCFVAFDQKKYALDAKQKFDFAYPNLWSTLVENNIFSS